MFSKLTYKMVTFNHLEKSMNIKDKPFLIGIEWVPYYSQPSCVLSTYINSYASSYSLDLAVVVFMIFILVLCYAL